MGREERGLGGEPRNTRNTLKAWVGGLGLWLGLWGWGCGESGIASLGAKRTIMSNENNATEYKPGFWDHRQVMVDLETWGTRPGSVIVSIGAVEFRRDGLGEEFYRRVAPGSCMDAGLTVDAPTVEWWLTQGEEARMECVEATASLRSVLEHFAEWVGPGTRLWSNGPDFDYAMLAAAYRATGLEMPVPHWGSRCYRTLKALNPNHCIAEREGTYHNALDDARHQAAMAREILSGILWRS